MTTWIYFGLASMMGGFARYFLTGFIYQIFGSNFPYGTVIVNLIGCFLIGLFATLAEERFLLNPEMKLILMFGFCGAFTTFSTFIFETDSLVKNGEMLKALANIFTSVLIGLLIFRAGVLMGKFI